MYFIPPKCFDDLSRVKLDKWMKFGAEDMMYCNIVSFIYVLCVILCRKALRIPNLKMGAPLVSTGP